MIKGDTVLKYLLLGWTCICIVLAVIYTYIQIKIYFDNEDVSTISFQQFEKGNEDKYPTYSICFEDSFIRQIYKTEKIATGCDFYGCQDGDPIWFAKLENKMILVWKEIYSQSFYLRKKRSSELMKSGANLALSNHYSPLKGNESRMTESRKKRFMPMFQDTVEGSYRLDPPGNLVVMMQEDRKTYAIAPQQLQQLITGINESLTYSFSGNETSGVMFKSIILGDFNYNVEDLWRFNFNSTIIDMMDLLLRFEVKTLRSVIYGWHNDKYKTLESYCQAKKFPQYNHKTNDCNVEESFLQNLEKMQDSGYPFEKTYQVVRFTCAFLSI